MNENLRSSIFVKLQGSVEEEVDLEDSVGVVEGADLTERGETRRKTGESTPRMGMRQERTNRARGVLLMHCKEAENFFYSQTLE